MSSQANPEDQSGSPAKASSSPPPPPPTVDEETLRKRAAAARAYALSEGNPPKKQSGKFPPVAVPHDGYARTARFGEAPSHPSRPQHLQHPPQHPPHYAYAPPPQHHVPPHLRPFPPPPPPYTYYPRHHYPMPTTNQGGGGGYPSSQPPFHAAYGHPPPPPPPPPYNYPPPPPMHGQSRPPGYSPRSGTAADPTTTMLSPNNTSKGRPPNSPATTKAPLTQATPPPPTATTATATETPERRRYPATGGIHKIIMPSASERLAAISAAAAAADQTNKTFPAPMDSALSPRPLNFGGDHNNNNNNEEDIDGGDDYAKFVKSLVIDGDFWLRSGDDDDDEFSLIDFDEDDDDGDDDEEEEEEEEEEENSGGGDKDEENGEIKGADSVATRGKEIPTFTSPPPKRDTTPTPTKKKKEHTTFDLPGFDPQFYKELEEELGGLEEEDLEAAVASLLGTTSTSYGLAQKQELAGFDEHLGENVDGSILTHQGAESDVNLDARSKIGERVDDNKDVQKIQEDMPLLLERIPTTPLRQATGRKTKIVVTPEQVERLQDLLKRHYQLLIQQAVLAIHAAHLQRTQQIKDKTEFFAGETGDDLVEILDGAIGMVQDLDQNRKDAIRNSIQFVDSNTRSPAASQGPRAPGHLVNYNQEPSSAFANERSSNRSNRVTASLFPREDRRLTRAAFSETLKQHSAARQSVFDIRGLHKLQETFRVLDNSVGKDFTVHGQTNRVEPEYTGACRSIMKQAEANYTEDLLPGTKDLADNFSSPKEVLGEDFEIPCDEEQAIFLRKSRNLFTSGEDNLVLRGTNLYGEKQWNLIADRYLSDRSINAISQRYSKLCVMLYKAHGIFIDSEGNLEPPKKLESLDDIDDEKVALVPKASPPAILNVHRWSLEEDVALLRAVPLMGHMWAELGARLIPHRDRGHLRKRYQVLERRVKATVTRSLKSCEVMSRRPTSEQPQQLQLGKTQGSQSNQEQGGKSMGASPGWGYKVQQAARKPNQPPSRYQAQQVPSPRSSDTQKPSQPLPPKPGYKAQQQATSPRSSGAQKPSQPSSLKPVSKVQPATSNPPSSPIHKRNDSAIFSPGTKDGTSLAAFEKVANETNLGWSQMSRIEEIIGNDVESEIVGALAGRLTRSKSNNPEELGKKDSTAQSVGVGRGGSIMENVLKRANGGSKRQSNSNGDKRKASSSPMKAAKRQSSSLPTESSKVCGSASKTADGAKASFPSQVDGTAPTQSDLSRAHDSVLETTAFGMSMDGLGLSNFGSRQSYNDREASLRLMNDAESYSAYNSPSKISFLNDPLMEENDLEAISALNSLSSSPGHSLTRKQTAEGGAAAATARPTSTAKKPLPTKSRKRPLPTNASKKGSAKEEEDKSFFARVLGGVHERDSKKRKLNFE